MKARSIMSLMASLTILGIGAFIKPQSVSAEPASIFRPLLQDIETKLPSNLVFRLPSRLPEAITRKMSPQLTFDVNSEQAYLALEDKDCLPRFRRGGRGFALACIRFSVASSTLASKYYQEDRQRGEMATVIQLSRNLRGYHFQGDAWNTVSWVQDNVYFKIYSGTVRRNELIEVARSMVASSPILPSIETTQPAATERSSPTSQSPPSHPIQNLPNGDYFYGKTSQANQVGQEYAFFRKSGNAITGIGYKRNTSYAYCFRGKINNNTIANATFIVLPDEYDISQTRLNQSLDLSRFRRLTGSDEQVNTRKKLTECFQLFERKR